MKNTAKKFSITLAPELANYVQKRSKKLNAPISKVIAFALASQKRTEAREKRKSKLLNAYKQIAEIKDLDDFSDFEEMQWELDKEVE